MEGKYLILAFSEMTGTSYWTYPVRDFNDARAHFEKLAESGKYDDVFMTQIILHGKHIQKLYDEAKKKFGPTLRKLGG